MKYVEEKMNPVVDVPVYGKVDGENFISVEYRSHKL